MDIVTHIVKYNSQTNGRDKLCRLFQYTSKLAWWNLDRLNKDPSLITKLKNLEGNFSTTRKVLRLGKSLDLVQGAVRSLSIPDTVYRLTLVLAKLNQACYLLVDHLIWAGKVGLVDVDLARWGRVSARFWLVSIICNLARNAYDVLGLARMYAAGRPRLARPGRPGPRGDADEPGRVLAAQEPIVVDVLKNCADLVLPLAALGYVSVSPGVQGAAGVLGSVVGILTVWNPGLKQAPA